MTKPLSLLTRQCFQLGLILVLLSGCASQKESEKPADETLTNTRVLAQLQQYLPGHYSNFAQQWQDQKLPLRLLDIDLLRASDTEAWYLTQQRENTVSGQQLRLQILAITTSAENHITFRFAPFNGKASQALTAVLNHQVAFLEGCEVTLFPAVDGLVGKTSAETCLLPGQSEHTGLIKSIKIQAGIITIGDQLAENGEVQGEISIQQFYRSQQFSGWAGKISAHTAWQRAAPFVIFSDGEELALVDSDGVKIGVNIRLTQVPWKKDEKMILRLDLLDPATGKTSAYAFTDANAESIGLNLGDVQLGLKRK